MLTRRSVLTMLAMPALRAQFGDAEAYEKFMGRWSRMLAPLLIDFTGIPESGRVLDVGSGTGALAFEISKRNLKCEVIGIDPAKEYVAYSNSKRRVRVKFEVGDAQQLRFPDASFDASASLLVFNFIPDPVKALREVRRVTKRGGPVSAAVWDYAEGMQMLRVFWDAAVSIDPAAEKLDEKRFPLCKKGALGALWRSGGLRDVEEKPLEISMQFASFDDYWNAFLLGEGPAGQYAKRLDPTKQGRLREELRRQLPSGAFNLTARAWGVRGVA